MILIRRVLFTFSILAFLSACASQEAVSSAPKEVDPEVSSTAATEPTDLLESVEKDEESQREATSGPDCLGSEISQIGQGIADSYENASYEEVMTWFCNGAEFEDITLALQSAGQSDASAEEMLVMLADGFFWDEIWQLLDITE